jgi:signal transduction histidine kinase
MDGFDEQPVRCSTRYTYTVAVMVMIVVIAMAMALTMVDRRRHDPEIREDSIINWLME